MRTVTITWQEYETTEHTATLNVPDDFDADNFDLSNALAQVEDSDKTLCEFTREVTDVDDDEFDPDADVLNLNGYDL